MHFIDKAKKFFNPAQKLLIGISVIAFLSYGSYKHWQGDAITIGGSQKITGVSRSLGENSDFNLVTQKGIKTAIDAVAHATGSDPWQVVDAAVWGAKNDVVVPPCCTLHTVTGTDSHDAIQNAINFAAPHQIVLVPFPVLIASPLDTFKKSVHLVFLSHVYTNGGSLFISGFPGGTDKMGLVEVYGTCFGLVNLPAHSAATYAAHTGPNWAGLTGACVTFYNCNKEKYRINRIEGFRYGVVLKAGGGTGGQENGFAGTWIQNCGTAVSFQSTDGNSFMDKAEIGGWDGGSLRLSGGLGIEYDGYAPAAAVNGETNNGAFRSNHIHAMMENVDSAIIANGDITENEFDITFELGPNGVHGNTFLKMLSTGPNVVRSPKYTGRGDLCTTWMTQGMGVNGQINMPIYYNCSTFIGQSARIDGVGNIIVDVSSSLTQATRALLPANIKTKNVAEPDNDPNTTASSFTLAANVHRITMNNPAGTVTFTSAANRPGDDVRVTNAHATNALTLAGVANLTSIPAGMTALIHSNNSAWNAEFYYVSGGGGGGGFWNADGAVDINFLHNVAVGRTTPLARFHIGPGTTTLPPFMIDPGPLTSVAKNWAVENDSFNLFFTPFGSTRRALLMVNQNAMLPGKVLQVSPSGNDFDFVWPSSSLVWTSHAELDVSAASSAAATSMLGLSSGYTLLHAIGNNNTILIEGSGFLIGGGSTSSPGIDLVIGSSRIQMTGGTLPTTISAGATYFYEYSAALTPTGTANQTLYKTKVNVIGLGTSVFAGQSGATFNTTTPVVNILGYFNNSGNQWRNYVQTIKVESVN